MSSLWQHPIQQWRTQYGLTAMLETGTYRGNSVIAALTAGYERVVTCEVDSRSLSIARVRIGDDARVTFFLGESIIHLPAMLLSIADQPALIFLDAHVHPSQFDSASSDVQVADLLPLPREIDLIISNRDCSRDVVIVDDLHLYTRERWIGPERAAQWELPTTPPPWLTAQDIAAKFPLHRSYVSHGLSALVLRPQGPVA